MCDEERSCRSPAIGWWYMHQQKLLPSADRLELIPDQVQTRRRCRRGSIRFVRVEGNIVLGSYSGSIRCIKKRIPPTKRWIVHTQPTPPSLTRKYESHRQSRWIVHTQAVQKSAKYRSLSKGRLVMNDPTNFVGGVRTYLRVGRFVG